MLTCSVLRFVDSPQHQAGVTIRRPWHRWSQGPGRRVHLPPNAYTSEMHLSSEMHPGLAGHFDVTEFFKPSNPRDRRAFRAVGAFRIYDPPSIRQPAVLTRAGHTASPRAVLPAPRPGVRRPPTSDGRDWEAFDRQSCHWRTGRATPSGASPISQTPPKSQPKKLDSSSKSPADASTSEMHVSEMQLSKIHFVSFRPETISYPRWISGYPHLADDTPGPGIIQVRETESSSPTGGPKRIGVKLAIACDRH